MQAVGRHVLISGVVQGVGYRAWTARTASASGLSGWVRNRHEGSVEAVFAGAAPTVDAMIAACWRGPRAAIVTGVAVTDHTEPQSPGFKVLPTA